MLVDLKSFNVIDCKSQTTCGQDDEKSNEGLNLDTAIESMSGNHEGSNVAENDHEDDEIAIDSMEEDHLVSDGGNKLKYR